MRIEPANLGSEDNRYKGIAILNRAVGNDRYVSIAGEDVAVMQLTTGQWWIIHNNTDHDDTFPALGPFDTAELAWSTLQLLKD